MMIRNGFLYVSLISMIAIQLAACSTLRPPTEDPVENKRVDSDVVLLEKSHFSILYSKQYSMPKMVEYVLRAEDLKKPKVQRRDNFFTDQDLLAIGLKAITPNHYKNSGYDRGHLAPSADFSWSSEANDSTFVMTNMLPQSPNLNRGSWKKLEDTIRKWACTEDILVIATGPVIEDGMKVYGDDLIVPNSFYKVVLDNTPPRKAIGFIFFQDSKRSVPLAAFARSVDEVEKYSGLDFFSDLDPEEQERIESEFEYSDWQETKCF